MPFHAEDDWSMPERQAEDKRRAEAKEAQRKMRYPEPVFARKPQLGNEETADRNWQKEEGKWERGRYTEWNNKQEEWKETEAQRSDRRSRNSKENLAGREKLRVAGIKKNEEREEKERRREEQIYRSKNRLLERRQRNRSEEREKRGGKWGSTYGNNAKEKADHADEMR